MSEDEAGPSSLQARPAAAAAPVFKKRNRARVTAPTVTASAVETSRVDATASNGDADDAEEEPSLSIADLIAFRESQRKPTGIDLDRLNKGVKKKKKKKPAKNAGGPQTEEDRWREQMERGGLVTRKEGRSGNDDDDDEDDADTAGKARRLIGQNNFQGETNVIDVDKHMMEYIEEEMRKRRAREGGSATAAGSTTASDVQAVLANPEDELYKVAEKYTRLQQEARNAAQANRLLTKKSNPGDEEGEGSAGLSSAMLSGIPEVELGMESRLKNIEDTERAKRALYESRQQRRQDDADQMLASARFMTPKRHAQSDADALAQARANAAKPQDQQDAQQSSTAGAGQKRGMGQRREMATDELVMQRFKKRQMNHLKK